MACEFPPFHAGQHVLTTLNRRSVGEDSSGQRGVTGQGWRLVLLHSLRLRLTGRTCFESTTALPVKDGQGLHIHTSMLQMRVFACMIGVP